MTLLIWVFLGWREAAVVLVAVPVTLALTLFVASLSLARGRTTYLHGAVHLIVFAAYLMTTILP